ncbi:MAG: alpha/beta fold hydrolase [Parvibaculaceae bacterium]
MSVEPARHPIVIDSAGGEYMESVVIVDWAASPGAPVKAGDTVVTVETAKAATEIAADRDGYLAEILFAVGAEAPVGSVLGYISDRPVTGAAAKSEALSPDLAPQQAVPMPAVERRSGRVVASPYARRIAAEQGVDLAELAGSGPGGRVKSRDVLSLPAAPSAAHAASLRHPVIFLHGFGADRSIWRWVTPLLHVSNRIVTLDLPGHGGSTAPLPGSIAEMANALAAEIAGLGITDAHVVGHSLGGAAALALGAVGGLRVHALGLLAPAGLGPEIDTAFLKGLLTAQTPDELQPWLDRMVADASSLPSNFAGGVLWQRKTANRVAEQLSLARALFPRGVQEERFIANLRALRVPAKIIWGKADAIIPMSHALAAPGIAGLHLLDGIGHSPFIECPDIIARLIDELIMSTGR